nr:chloroplast envelope membrane protein [Uronema sp. CCAP 334/1]
MTELEKIGLIPRSIVRMLDRFYYQIYLGTAEPLVKQFRFSKYLLLTSVKSLLLVLFIPFFINIFTKIYIFRPIVEYFWDRKQTEIFLNYELQEKAFLEIHKFEEKLYFDYLIKTENNFFFDAPKKTSQVSLQNHEDPKNPHILLGVDYRSQKNYENFSISNFFVSENETKNQTKEDISELLAFITANTWKEIPSKNLLNQFVEPQFFEKTETTEKTSFVPIISKGEPKKLFGVPLVPIIFKGETIVPYAVPNDKVYFYTSFSNSMDTLQYDFSKNTEFLFRKKTRELANHYNNESISALTNLLADFMGLLILLFLLINMKMSLMNTTAFLSESFFSLKDSKKAFLMLLFTDLLVGFHSPRGWEVIFHFLFEHFGLPENHNIIFLLVGTFPVLLDALFKYWIFRHLNRHSPATVATFQAMVE